MAPRKRTSSANTSSDRRWLSDADLIERWRLTDLPEEAQRRYLRHLRERRLIVYTKPTPRRVLYSLASVEKLEEEGLVESR